LSEATLRRLWRTAIFLLVAAIVVGSLAPQQAVSIVAISDKLAHFLAYLALALAVSGISTPQRLWRAMLGCILLGATLELGQAVLTEQRSAEWGDLAANAAGIATAWLVVGRGSAGWGLRAGAWLARRSATGTAGRTRKRD
jgi:VanZ family protein